MKEIALVFSVESILSELYVQQRNGDFLDL